MTEKNDQAKQQLIARLKNTTESGRPLLMAGAGSSMLMGYPSWGDLVAQMAALLSIPPEKPAGATPIVYADIVKKKLESENRLDDYHNFLEKSFAPKSKNHEDFHLALLQLGICGIITTNYDHVLESALAEATYSHETGPLFCEPLDLCLERKFPVFDFLRSLSRPGKLQKVLHLHGYYRNPKEMILTDTDYRKKYGELEVDGKPSHRNLDSTHRKVLWSLLTMHWFVFVGFSMEDGFFTHMLKVVQEDFSLGSEPAHFAILPQPNDRNPDDEANYLSKNGITAVFYPVPEGGTLPNSRDHTGLRNLILELAELMGIPIGSSSLRALNKKLLEL